MRLVLVVAILCGLTLPAMARDQTVPDPHITPGALNPAVTQGNIRSTICKPNWTKTVRPPASFTNKLKRQQLAEYGYGPKTDLHALEEDHRVPLEAGGNPRDPKNLWTEPWAVPVGVVQHPAQIAVQVVTAGHRWRNRMSLSVARKFHRCVVGKSSMIDRIAFSCIVGGFAESP